MISSEVALKDMEKLARSVHVREKAALAMGMLGIVRNSLSDVDMMYTIMNSAYSVVPESDGDAEMDINDPRR